MRFIFSPGRSWHTRRSAFRLISSRFVWKKYRELSPTARRMFDYFVSHKTPFPLKLERFRLMCGSDSSRVKKWREQSGIACDEPTKRGFVELPGCRTMPFIANADARRIVTALSISSKSTT